MLDQLLKKLESAKKNKGENANIENTKPDKELFSGI